MSVHLRLLDGARHRDDDVAQHIRAGFIVVVVDTVLSQREGEDIGGGVLVAELPVELADLLVIHKADAHLCGTLKLFHCQHCTAAAANQQPDAGWHLDRLLSIRNRNLNSIHNLICAPPCCCTSRMRQ